MIDIVQQDEFFIVDVDGLKTAPVYKQISQVGLPYHLGQLYPALLTCIVIREILCNVQDLK